MKTRLRAVKIRVMTTGGPAAAIVTFTAGLNVVRASNSRGKTQSLQAVVYALGLESMFGPNAGTSLGSALTNQLAFGEPERPVAVKSSWCAVELENDHGIITAQRSVKHSKFQPNLVRVWRGAAITGNASFATREDFFVRESGAAKNPRGFHRFLAEYLGWDLPMIPRYTGGEATLYPEIIFPFLYADQRSWGSAAPRPVTQYQLREPTRRAAEFLLGFTGPETAARRYRLEDQLKTLRGDWSSRLAAVEATATSIGGRLLGLPDLPAGGRSRGGSRPSAPTTTRDVKLQILVDEEWRDEEEVLSSLRDIAEVSNESEIGEIGHDLISEHLRELEQELARLTTMARIVEQNLTLNEKQLATLQTRLIALQDEKAKNQDIKTLLRLGSSVGLLDTAGIDCPTCHQPLANVEAEAMGPVLDVDATISLLSSQIRTFEEMRDQAQEAATESQASFRAIQRAVDTCRAEIRGLRRDLVSPEHSVSAGEIAKRVAAEVRLTEFTRMREAIRDSLEEMQGLSESIFQTRMDLMDLAKVTPQEDGRRRDLLEVLVREQLTDFGFSSYSANMVGINEETLRPEREGFNLDTDASASDVVRTKIAYLNGVRELAHNLGSPHPGFLLLDEPRQHELDEEHFRATLRRLARCSETGDQVVATSAASVSALAEMLGDADANVIDLGSQRLIRPASADDPMDF